MTICPFCDEPVWSTDDAVPLNGDPQGGHRECVLRQVSGSVGHMRGECSCYGKVDTSEEGMTKREAAKAAVAEYMAGFPNV
jgi:hypothetical protein